MKKLLLVVLAVLYLTTEILADIPCSITLNNPTRTTFQKIIANGGSISYDKGAGYSYQIGKYYNPNDLSNRIFRAYWYFSLGDIPTNATITSVYLNIYNSASGYSLKLTLVPSQSTNDGDNWAAIGNGTILNQGVQYSPMGFYSTPVKNAMQTALPYRSMIIGALSESESTAGSMSTMSMTLDVNYTRPPATINFSAHNDMDSYTGGHIGVGINTTVSDLTSPYSATATEGQIANIQAYDNNNYNSNNGYYYLFNDTEAPQNKSDLIKLGGGTQHDFGNSSSGSYTFLQNDNNSVFIAYLKKVCNATFQNTGNQITINGNQYSSSGTVPVVAQNSVTVSTLSSYTNNGIDYTFSCWTNAGSNYSSPITVSSNITYTAKYIGTPNITNQVINFGTTLYEPIVVYWTDNPNTNVNQYQIYRRIGYIRTPTLIGTVGRGVQQFTDNTWTRMPWKVDTLLCYEVKEYYSIDQTYSPDYWASVYGSNMYKLKNNEGSMASAGEIPTEYKLENYPNPFNPVTVINYQLPQDGFVTLKVYDMLGKEVAAVVNEYKNAGYYKVNFDASRLTSGVYIYTINTNNFFLSKKMLLMK